MTENNTGKQESQELTDTYVREYYDRGLKKIEGEYTRERWLSSVERRFDYQQTRGALMKALGTGSLGRVLEVGPGDGTWTELFADRTAELNLVDQSKEMLARARKRLTSFPNITYTLEDFLTYEPKQNYYDHIISVRCFEYFEDKQKAIANMRDALAPGGTIVLITKNPQYKSMQPKKDALLHTGQTGKRELTALFRDSGLVVEAVYPAVYRWKATYGLMRALFRILHWLAVTSRGVLIIPFVTDWSTESYVYVAHKPKKIIELYGLPGSGKTSLSKKLAEKHMSTIRQQPTRRGFGLAYFIAQFPGVFFFWMKEFSMSIFGRGASNLARFRLAILLDTLEAVGRAWYQEKGMVILEEGLFQRVASVYEVKKTSNELMPIVQHIPLPDALVVVDVTEEHFARYRHSDHPRAQLGENYLEAWKVMVEHNHQSLLEAIDRLGVTVLHAGKDTDVDLLYEELLNL